MAKSRDYPYSRLVDPEIARANPADISALRRTITAAFIVVAVAVVVAAGTMACLAALLYVSRLGAGETTVASDVHRYSTPGPASSATGASAAESPMDLVSLLDRLNSLEKEVASLKVQCRCYHTLLDTEHKSKQTSEHEHVRSHLQSTANSKMEVQEKSSEKATDRPNGVPVYTNHGSARRQGSLHATPMTSHRDQSSLATSSSWPRPPAAESTDTDSGYPEPHLKARYRKPRSKDRTKERRRDREETTEDEARLPPSGSGGDRPEGRGGGGGSGGDGGDGEHGRGQKKQRRPASRNSERNQRMSGPSSDMGGNDRETTCIHCIDTDKIISGHGRPVEDDNFRAFGRAVHIQGNRGGNIRINNADGWVRGFQTWKMADWTDDTDRYFSLNPLGSVTVGESGIYYVYSQILFYDPNDTVGQSIYINDDPRFTCTKSNISAEAKQSTCYVGGVVRMSAGDTVGIKLSIPAVTIALYADTSYFGLFRVA